MKRILLILLSLFFITNAFSQYPGIQWQKCLGGSADETGYCIRQTSDSGYIVCGSAISNNGDVTGNHGNSDIWVIKLNINGSINWQKTYGGSSSDVGFSIQQTYEGGYILVGYTVSNDGDVTSNHGGSDIWIIKLNASGGITWQKTYGGTGYDAGYSISQTTDSGYIVAGNTKSTDGDVTGFHGGLDDIWILKINKNGTLLWQKCLGGSDDDYTYNNQVVQQTKEGGYIVAGCTRSGDGNVTGYHGGAGPDAWVIKLNDTGGISWEKTYGGTSYDEANSILQLSDSSYIIGGGSASTDGDVTGYHGGGSYDMWVLKITSSGGLTWQKCLGGSGDDMAYSTQQTTDGGYIFCGYTSSADGDVSNLNGGYDMWVVKLNATGSLLTQTALGGDSDDFAYSVRQTFDNGYVLTGYTKSHNGDVSGKHGGTDGSEDMWVVKLNKNLKVEPLLSNTNNIKVYPNVTHNNVVVELSENNKDANLSLIDILGNPIQIKVEYRGLQRIIYLNDIPSGMYILQVANDKEVQIFKIIYQP